MPLKDFNFALMDARLGSLRASPEGVLSLPLDRFPISVRLCNLLKCANCRTVYDLVTRGTIPVVGTKGFGKLMGSELESLVSSLVDHSRSLGTAVEEIEPQVAGQNAFVQFLTEPVPCSLIEQIERGLANLDPRDSLVWKARSGYDGTAKTLDEIGATLAISRERARQLEQRANSELLKWVPGRAELPMTLSTLLDQRSEPLSVDWLASTQPLFKGLERRLLLFAHIVKDATSDGFHVWELKGASIVTRVSASGWQRLKILGEKTLSSQIRDGITQGQAQLITNSMASEQGVPELANALFESLQTRLHFGTMTDAKAPILVAVGRSMSGALKSILENAATPLSLAEIARQLQEKTGARRTKMALRNALSSIGAHVFSRRRYGLEKHSAIPPAAINPIIETVHVIMNAGSSDRQWHCADLTEMIKGMRPDLSSGLDPHTLNVVLSKSSGIEPLGRLVWRTGSSAGMHSEERRSIAELCVDALESAGKPLRKAALARRVRAIRGLGDNFMPQPSRSMARLRPGVWGLLARDFPFSLEEQAPILDRLEAALLGRSKALHASELASAINLETDRPLKLGRSIWGLAQTDNRFRTGRGHLIGLAEWSSLGRHNSYSAIRDAIKRIHEFATPEKLYSAVDELAERHVSRDRITAELKALGHKYEIRSRRWVRAPESAGTKPTDRPR